MTTAALTYAHILTAPKGYEGVFGMTFETEADACKFAFWASCNGGEVELLPMSVAIKEGWIDPA